MDMPEAIKAHMADGSTVGLAILPSWQVV